MKCVNDCGNDVPLTDTIYGNPRYIQEDECGECQFDRADKLKGEGE